MFYTYYPTFLENIDKHSSKKISFCHVMEININQPGQGPVLWRSINTNLELNFRPGSFSFCLKAFHRIIFSVIFSVSNHQIVDKKMNFIS